MVAIPLIDANFVNQVPCYHCGVLTPRQGLIECDGCAGTVAAMHYKAEPLVHREFCRICPLLAQSRLYVEVIGKRRLAR